MAAPSEKLFFIWNFFESIPPTGFIDHWLQALSYVGQNKDFIVTQLHQNLNQDGTYKYVNHAAFDGVSFEGFQQTKPSEEWLKIMASKPSNHVARPGGYTEIGTNTGKPLAPWLPKDDKSIFIVTAFKVSDEKDASLQETFEKNWMESSGANYILQNAPKELGISHCGLYKKFTPRPGVLYVLRTEVTGVGQSSEPAKAFLNKLKDFQFPEYFEQVDVELYWIDPQYITHTDAKKDLPEGFTYKP